MQLDDLQAAMNVRKQFQDAVVSYIVLMGIDWNSMACDCKGKRGVVVDGTQVAYKSLSSLLSQNWRVPPPDFTPIPQTDPCLLSFVAGAPGRALELLHKFVLVYRRRDKKKKKHIVNVNAGLDAAEFGELYK